MTIQAKSFGGIVPSSRGAAPVAAPWTPRLASLCCVKIFISNLAEESAHKTSLKNFNGTL